MCPDRQMLSVYMDGELPSPWNEKMQSHLEQCPECRERLAQYRLASPYTGANTEYAATETAHIDAARERVWRNLETMARFRSGGAVNRGVSVWRRRISIPFPAAAAAAVLLIVMAAFRISRPQPEQPAAIPQMTLASEEGLAGPDVIPVADMSGVLQYLGNRDNGGDILILRLPESRSFMSSGEPAILKAADYSRSSH